MAGRAEKGDGVGTTAGYYMEMITRYMDITVEATNLYNTCEMDYIMQAFGPILTSLSGFLGALTSLLEVILSADEVATYTGISKSVYDLDRAGAG